MVTIEDYVDAFEKDALTQTVMLYVESVKNGRRFLERLSSRRQKKAHRSLKAGRVMPEIRPQPVIPAP